MFLAKTLRKYDIGPIGQMGHGPELVEDGPWDWRSSCSCLFFLCAEQKLPTPRESAMNTKMVSRQDAKGAKKYDYRPEWPKEPRSLSLSKGSEILHYVAFICVLPFNQHHPCSILYMQQHVTQVAYRDSIKALVGETVLAG